MNARAFTRVLKLSQTVVDLEGVDDTKTQHLAEEDEVLPSAAGELPAMAATAVVLAVPIGLAVAALSKRDEG